MSRANTLWAGFLVVCVLAVATAHAAIPPAAPRGLVAVDTPNDQGRCVDIQFIRSADEVAGANSVTSYKVYLRPPGGSFNYVGTIAAAAKYVYTYRVIGLTKNLAHQVGVSALAGDAESPLTVMGATALDNIAPRPPAGLRLGVPSPDEGHILTVNISPSPDDGTGADDVLNYTVFYRLNGTTPWILWGNVPAADSANYRLQLTGLQRNKSYDVKVTAGDGDQRSTEVTETGSTVDSQAPRPPRNVAVNDVAADQGQQLWVSFDKSLDDGADANDVRQYIIFQRKSILDPFVEIGRLNANGAANYGLKVSGLTPGATYDFGVQATDGANTSSRVVASGTVVDNTAPRPPVSIRAVVPPASNGHGVTVNWGQSPDDGTGVDDVRRYFLYQKGVGDSAFTRITDVAAADQAYYFFRVTGLTKNSTYTFGVTAYDGVQESSMVTIGVATPDNQAPRPPTNFVVADVPNDNGDKLRLSFNRSGDDGQGENDVTQYLIGRMVNATTWVQLGVVAATGSAGYSYQATGLTPGVACKFSVQATDGTNTCARVIAAGTPLNNVPPAPPTNPLAQPPAGDNGTRMVVSFGRSADDGAGAGDVVRYNVAVAPAGTTAWALKLQIPATGAATYQGTITGLAPGRTYTFGITAGDGANVSTRVTTNGTTVDSQPPRPPSSPAVSDVAGDQGTQVRLTFAKSPDDGGGSNDVTFYRLTKRQGTAAFTEIGRVPATKAATYQTTITGLSAGQTYDFGIQASDGPNLSPLVTVTGGPVDNTAPAPPSALTIADVPNDDGNALIVGFNASPDDGAGADDVAEYRLYHAAASGGSWTQIGTIPATNAATYSTTVTGLKPGVTRRYSVTAFDGRLPSVRIEGAGAAVDNTPPGPPRNLTLADVPSDAGTALFVRFDASVDDVTGDREVTSYRITRGTATGPAGVGTQAVSTFTVAATGAASYEYKDQTLTAGTTYYYKVVAVAPTGESVPTAEARLAPEDNRTVSPPSGLTAQDRPYDKGGVIELAWTKSGDDGGGQNLVTKYYVYRRMANVVTAPTRIGTITATGAATYKWNDTTVPMNLILYDYTVTAAAASGKESTASGPARASADDNNVVVFDPPTNLTAEDLPADAGGQILLTWRRSVSENDIGPPPPPPLMVTAGGYGGQYEFYRRTAGAAYPDRPSFTVSADGTNDPMTYVDKGLANGTRYYYKVLYRRYNQISTFSGEASAIPAVGTGTASASASQTAGASDAAATLHVSLGEPPAAVAAGSDLVVTAQVTGAAASSVCLEWTLDGIAVQRTSAVSGTGQYEAQLTLKTSTWARGTAVRIRAVATDGRLTATSATSDVTVQ